jgi:FKBP-type peptidyl-prolyl cis-trans isomerase
LFRLVYLSLVFLLFSCGKPLERQSNSNHSKIQKIDKSKSIEMNKLWVKDEIFKIDQYCLRYGWNMVIQSENSTIKPIIGSEVTMSYDVRLMDSKQTKCYHSDSNGLAKFKVEKSLIESGINEVVSMLRKGDSALVILPHHIAHGLTGDSKKIPPLSTVLYFIKILDVNE